MYHLRQFSSRSRLIVTGINFDEQAKKRRLRTDQTLTTRQRNIS